MLKDILCISTWRQTNMCRHHVSTEPTMIDTVFAKRRKYSRELYQNEEASGQIPIAEVQTSSQQSPLSHEPYSSTEAAGDLRKPRSTIWKITEWRPKEIAHNLTSKYHSRNWRMTRQHGSLFFVHGTNWQADPRVFKLAETLCKQREPICRSTRSVGISYFLRAQNASFADIRSQGNYKNK